MYVVSDSRQITLARGKVITCRETKGRQQEQKPHRADHGLPAHLEIDAVSIARRACPSRDRSVAIPHLVFRAFMLREVRRGFEAATSELAFGSVLFCVFQRVIRGDFIVFSFDLVNKLNVGKSQFFAPSPMAESLVILTRLFSAILDCASCGCNHMHAPMGLRRVFMMCVLFKN